MRTSLTLVLLLILSALSAFAGPLKFIDVQMGYWDGSTFTTSGEWNTYAAANWAVAVTDPGYGDPQLNVYPSLTLPGGEYWLYMAQAGDDGNPSLNSIQITLGFGLTPDDAAHNLVEVFTSPAGFPEFHPGWEIVSGSGFAADLVLAPQSDYLLVGPNPQNYTPSGQNWIVDLDFGSVPEPASWALLAAGSALLALFRHKRKLA